jgi:NADH-quinone oxidoreductase subunit E
MKLIRQGRGEVMNTEDRLLENEIGRVRQLIGKHERNKSLLVPFLHRIQEEHGFLPMEMMERLSAELTLPLSEIYGVASFYRQFHFSPRGRVIVRVCTGTACHVRGASALLQSLQKRFKIGVGETTPNLSMTLETVGCIGCCGLAPVATVNDKVVGDIHSRKLIHLVRSIEEA